jgi:peroxiredoxin Q/BCP
MKLTIQLAIVSFFIIGVLTVNALEIGKPAPDFTLTDQHNQPQSLSKMKGKWVVLYFYPKDETPGCVAEACSFRDNIVAIKAKNTVVLGVSVDNNESHELFSENHQLPFILLADPDGHVAKKYGSLRNLVLFKIAKRHSFIINPQGNIAKIYRHVNPKTHVAEILEDLKLLQ